MRKVEKTGSGAYKVRFRGPRKKGGWGETSETFPTRREADQFNVWLHALGAQGALDQLYAAEQQKAVPTLDVVAADFIALRTKASEGTRLNYTRLWSRTWGPLIGHLQANRVTEDDLARAVMRLGQTYSHKSLENQQGLLSGVIGRCVREGYQKENIARAMPLPAGVSGESAEMRIITPDEFADVCEATPEHYRPFLRFLYGTGARFSEAIALEVRDVQLPNVRIRRALKWSPDNQRTVGPPKTKNADRTIALPAELHEEMHDLCAGKPRDALVFTAPRGGMILHRTFWSRVWLPAVRDIVPRPRIHDCRHSHASWLLANGAPIHVVQKRLGHHSIQVTVDTYSHLLPDAQLMAAQVASLAFARRPEIEG